jgi:hypothetical protein
LRALERRRYGDTFWHLYAKLDLFRPNVAGQLQQVITRSFLAAEQLFPLLDTLVQETGSCRSHVVDAEAFCQTDAERAAARQLKCLFDGYGSDKATVHDYHFVYGAIMARMQKVDALLEVGLGTNDPDAVSNMGVMGRPGASLRAFRDYLPRAHIYGADVDRRILFEEERIRTFFVDQTEPTSFHDVEALGRFDVVIDDGLHSPNANLAVLLLGIRRINVGGWIVIEDIPCRALPVWKVVGSMLPADYRTSLVRAQAGWIFAVERTA